jgi:hypothetical protein
MDDLVRSVAAVNVARRERFLSEQTLDDSYS